MRRAQDINKDYQTDDDVLRIRSFRELDHLRALGFPDDIMVLFVQEGLQTEGIWRRKLGFSDVDNDFITARMLTEPEAPFGVHRGDIIDATLIRRSDGKIVAVAVL